MTKNLILCRNIYFSENIFAFFETSLEGEHLPPIFGKSIDEVLLSEKYWTDEKDPNPDGSFPVYNEEDLYIGRLFIPIN